MQPAETYAARLKDFDQLIAERRRRMGRALWSLYGTTPPLAIEIEQADGSFEAVTLDFSTPDAVLATAEDTRLPVDLRHG